MHSAVRGRTGQVALGAAGYGPRSSRELRTCAAQCLGSQFAVRGRTGQVAPVAARYRSRSSRELRTCAAQCLGSQFAPMAARCRSCSSKDIAHVRGVWLVGDWKSRAYFAVRGRTGQVAPMAAGYGPRSSRGLRTCAGCSWSGIGKAWHTSWCVAARDKLRPGRRAYGSCLWLVLIERVVYVREVWLVRDWKGLAMGGVWPGAVHLDWSKSPRWMGARRCAGVPCQAGRGGNSSERDSFLVSFAQKLDAKNTGIPVKQRERHFAVILVG